MTLGIENKIKERIDKFNAWAPHLFDMDEEILKLCLAAASLHAQYQNKEEAENFFNRAEDTIYGLWQATQKSEEGKERKEFYVLKEGGSTEQPTIEAMGKEEIDKMIIKYRQRLYETSLETGIKPKLLPYVRTPGITLGDKLCALNVFINGRYQHNQKTREQRRRELRK